MAAFFLKKFGNIKSTAYERPTNASDSTQRPFTPTQLDDPYGNKRRAKAGSALSSSLGVDYDFTESTLEAINAARRSYNAQPVVANDQMSLMAQRWAEQMARTGKLEHSPAETRHYGRQTLGENYAAFFQSELTGCYAMQCFSDCCCFLSL